MGVYVARCMEVQCVHMLHVCESMSVAHMNRCVCIGFGVYRKGVKWGERRTYTQSQKLLEYGQLLSASLHMTAQASKYN